ncbi:recombinase family protein [Bacillus salipaludis]|uniref:Recombinase family protein n=1 Tax=Bacillus salipaludis TaxID=2547811 RepID=A0ABW8RHK3_9BACI
MPENNKLQGVRVAIYTRNTSIEQPEGRRLYRDVQVLKEKYERMGYKIQGIYSDVGCHGLKRRLELNRLFKDAFLGLFDVVLVWDLFSLTSNPTDLSNIQRFLAQYNVELCSATEPFDTSTPDGMLHFQWMVELLEHEHLACKRDISLSSLARLIMTKGACMKGDEPNAEPCIESVRPA